MSEAVDDGPLLTVQNPADMVGETVIDYRPSVLPVYIPLSALSPRTVDNAREISSFKPPQETGQSIMDMDTNEITINRIVGSSGMNREQTLKTSCLHRPHHRFRTSPL